MPADSRAEAVSMTAGVEEGSVEAPTADASNPELSVSRPESRQQQPLLVSVFWPTSSKSRSVLIEHRAMAACGQEANQQAASARCGGVQKGLQGLADLNFGLGACTLQTTNAARCQPML